MVYSGEKEKVRKFMAMGPERSKPLHNFTLPCLKWGSQRHLRCMKVESAADAPANDHRLRRRSPPSKFDNSSFAINTRRRESDQHQSSQNRRLKPVPSKSRINGSEEGIDAVREKIMLDLKTAADKMKDAILREKVSDDGEDEEEEEEAEEKEKAEERQEDKEKEKQREESPVAAEEVRPWNLRTRRAACKAPIGGAGSNHNNSSNHNVNNNNNNNNNVRGLGIEERRVNYSPMRSEGAKSPRGRERGGSEKERAKFSVPLRRKEIEEDFMKMVGHRPPRRPQKRPKTVQKQMDTLFPGLWLTEVTADLYKVPDFPAHGKR